MLKTVALIVIIVFSVTFAAAQPAGAAGTAQPKPERLRDLSVINGLDLQFLIRELARDMGLNVVFDVDSFRRPRKASIELHNITPEIALKALLRQERLVAEPIDAKTILVSLESLASRGTALGVGFTSLSDQLLQYFGAAHGVLINNVDADTPAGKAGLKAGDVITEVENQPVQGVMALQRATKDKPGADITLKIIRDRKSRSIVVPAPKAVE